MKSIFLVLSLCLVWAKAQKTGFCPLEGLEDNFECRSRKNSFKCGAFLVDLAGAKHKLSWLGAMPDLLAKKSVRENPEFLRSFGIPVTRKSFLFPQKNCDEITANSRCYAFMLKASKTTADKCDLNILNEEVDKKIVGGNVLCQKATQFIGNNPQVVPKNVKIGFYYSACGSEWKPVNNEGANLHSVEELCCEMRDGELKWAPCDGRPFTDRCD